MNPLFLDVEALEQYLEGVGAVACALQDDRGVLLLASVTEEGRTFYQGLPFALDEEGKDVDQHRGYFDTPPDEGAPTWPITLIAVGVDC